MSQIIVIKIVIKKKKKTNNYDEMFKEYLYKNKIYKLLEELFEKITAPNKTKIIQETFTITYST